MEAAETFMTLFRLACGVILTCHSAMTIYALQRDAAYEVSR